MGVIYKLKPSIVDFIIETKQKSPQLSCRSLVAAIHEQFQLEVSKSSINQVIKSASLSNPVGRPVGFRRERKFKIPEEKKTQLFSAVPSALMPAPQEALGPKIPERSAAIAQADTREKYTNLGFIFLKAAINYLSPKAFLGKVYAHNGIEDADLPFLEAALYFGERFAQNIDSFDEKDARWLLSGINLDVQKAQLKERLAKFSEIKKTTWDLGLDWNYLNTRATTLRIIFNDAKQVMFKIDEGGYVLKNTENLGCAVPIEKAVEDLSREFFGNKPICLDLRPSGLVEDFHLFALACENPGQGIKSLSLLDSAQNVVADFEMVSLQKRYFMAVIYAEQIKDELTLKGNKEGIYTNNNISLRFTIICNDLNTNKKIAILTNIPETIKNSEVMTKESQKLINILKGQGSRPVVGEQVFQGESINLDFSEQMKWLGDRCSKLALELYYPLVNNDLWNKSFLESVFSLPGYVIKEKDGLRIEITIPETFLIEPHYFQRIIDICIRNIPISLKIIRIESSS